MTNTFKLRRILQCVMLSTSLTMISDVQSMPGIEQEGTFASQAVFIKLTSQERTEMREGLYPYFTKLLGQEEAGDFQAISQGFESQKLRVFMSEADTFKRIAAAFFLSKTSLNALSAIRVLTEYYPNSENLFLQRGRHDSASLEDLQKTWSLIQNIESESERAFATQAFYNFTSRMHVNLSDFSDFSEIKENYPWVRFFAIDIERIGDEDVDAVIRSEDLQGLKFYGAKSSNREIFGISGYMHHTHFNETTQPLAQNFFDALAEILPKVSRNLVHIKFSGLGLNEFQLDGLFGRLLRFKGLKSFGLSHDHLTGVSAQRLSKLLMQLPQLEILHLSDCALDANGLGALRGQIKKLPLYELQLSGFDLTKVGIDHLVNALEDHPTLKSLNLGNINSDDQQKIPEERTEIRSKEEEDEDISPQVLEKLRNIIMSLRLHSLRVLLRSGDRVLSGEIALSGVGSPSLRQLGFSFYETDDEVLGFLLQRLSHSSVQILGGGGPHWKIEHLGQITEALEQEIPLQELDFSKRSSYSGAEDKEDFVPSEIVDRFAVSLKRSFITVLMLSNWKFKEEDLLKIVDAIAEIPFFSDLSLSNTGVTTRVLQRLLDVMKSRPYFISLDIDRNDLSEEDSAMILDALDEMEESKIHVSSPEIEWLEEDHYSPPPPYDSVLPFAMQEGEGYPGFLETIEEGAEDPSEVFPDAQGILFGFEKEE